MFQENLNQYQLAINLMKGPLESALDLGCWDKRLKKYLPKKVKYQGVDFEKSNYFKKENDVINHDLEKGLLMFKAKSFDAVFLLRVLQSINNPYLVFSEALRVAKNGLIVSFSNMHYWVYRLQYLFGKYPIDSMKFFPTANNPKSFGRHKWIINYNSAKDFVGKNAPGLKIKTAPFIYNHSRLKLLNVVERVLSRFWPNLFVHTVIFHISKT